MSCMLTGCIILWGVLLHGIYPDGQGSPDGCVPGEPMWHVTPETVLKHGMMNRQYHAPVEFMDIPMLSFFPSVFRVGEIMFDVKLESLIRPLHSPSALAAEACNAWRGLQRDAWHGEPAGEFHGAWNELKTKHANSWIQVPRWRVVIVAFLLFMRPFCSQIHCSIVYFLVLRSVA